MLKVSRHAKSPAQLSPKSRTKNTDSMASLRMSPIPRSNSNHNLQAMNPSVNQSHKEHKFKKRSTNKDKKDQSMSTVIVEAPTTEVENTTSKKSAKKNKPKYKGNKLNPDIPLAKLNSNPPLTRENYRGPYKQTRRNSVGSLPDSSSIDINQLEFLKRINAENSSSPNLTYQPDEGPLSEIISVDLKTPKMESKGKSPKRASKARAKTKAVVAKAAPPISILTYASRSKKDIVDLIPSIQVTNEDTGNSSSDESIPKPKASVAHRKPSSQLVPDFLLKLLQGTSPLPEKKPFFDSFGSKINRSSHSDTESEPRTSQRALHVPTDSLELNRVNSHSASLYAGPSFGRSPAPNSLPFPAPKPSKFVISKPNKSVVSLDYLNHQSHRGRTSYLINNLAYN